MTSLVQSMERRRKRRQERTRALFVALAFVLGLLFGWLALGWGVFPHGAAAEPAALSPDAQIDYVEVVLQAWRATGDAGQAQERLRGLDPQRLSTILNDLRTAYALSGEQAQADAVTSFAQSIALTLAPPAKVLGATAQAGPVPTALPFQIAVSKDVPQSVLAAIEGWAREQNATLVAPGGQAQVTVGTEPQTGSILMAERFYVVVDRFATLRDSFSMEQLRMLWNGQTVGSVRALLVTPEAADGLNTVIGPRALNVQTVSPEALITRLYTDTTTLGVVAFDQLEPRMSVLSLDGQNILAHDFRPEAYPLASRIYVSGPGAPAQRLVTGVRQHLARTNRDPERITTLIMTGTTAVTRTSAVKIEQKKDPAYPARLIGPTLASADITHISNEIPFKDDCQAVLSTMTFCSKPAYMATFKLAGVKIVGLTGNHLLDFGTAPFIKTLDLYDAAGMKYYGGGRSATEAARPLLLEDHGNRLAFIGMNSYGPPGVWATAGQPGALRYDASTLQKMIADARARSDVVLVELQGEETYDYVPSAYNQTLFRATLAAGADVVTGVQAHQPQAFEFSADGHRLILYGLGNLFFDQMFELGVRQELIARHTIYQGRLIQTELLTAMLEDSVQPRWMTPAERAALVSSLVQASVFK